MPTGGGYCHPAGSSQRKSPVPAPGPRCREFSRGLTGAPRSGAPPFIPARPQSPAVPATAGAPEGPAAQRALRRVPAVLLSPLSLPHGCLQLRILKAFPPAAAAVSALTRVSAGWGFPVIPAVHIRLFYHICVFSNSK